MLSRAANKTKHKQLAGGEEQDFDGDVAMDDNQGQGETVNQQQDPNNNPLTSSSSQQQQQQELLDAQQEQQQQQVVEEAMPSRWERNAEKERDKILGFFIISDCSIPRDIFHFIMSFVPAFPYYFTLRSVCSQWLYEFEEQLYSEVQYLDLLQTGRPNYYFRGEQLVQYKPLYFCGRAFPTNLIEKDLNYSISYDQTPIYEFIGRIFCNVKHLKLTYGPLYSSRGDGFSQSVVFMLPQMTALETLDVVGACLTPANRHYSHEFGGYTVESLFANLPKSVKTLRISNVTISIGTLIELRNLLQKSQESDGDDDDDERFTIENLLFERCIFENRWHSNSDSNQNVINGLRGLIPNFKISVVQEACGNYVDLSEMFLISKLDSFKHLVEKDGLVVAALNGSSYSTLNTVEYSECVMKALVNEYEQFRDLISYRQKQDRERPYFQEKMYTSADLEFFSRNFCHSFDIIEFIVRFWTDISKVKFPELLLDLNDVRNHKTFISSIIPYCLNSQGAPFLKWLFEEMGAKFAVNGARSYLLEACVHPNVREDVISYLLESYPKLITLGNSEGLIEGDVEELPIIHLCVIADHGRHTGTPVSVPVIDRLVRYGAPLTHLDNLGNNLLHLAVTMRNIEMIDFLFRLGQKDMLYQKNNFGQTPLALCVQIRSGFSYTPSLDILEKLVNASEDPDILKNCQTPDGTLIHSIMRANTFDESQVKYLQNNGVDVNARNEKGETALFYIRSSEFANRNGMAFAYRYRYRYYGHQDDHYFDEHARQLINLGADPMISDNTGVDSIMNALSNLNFKFINLFISDPDLSKKFDVAKSLKARTPNGTNALHFLFKALDILLGFVPTMNKNQKVFQKGAYVVIKKCIAICLKQYPEMLYEISKQREQSEEGDSAEQSRVTPPPTDSHYSFLYPRVDTSDIIDNNDILGISPLQFILEATNGMQILKDVGIKIPDIANRPVYNKPADSDQDESHIPIPAMYMALEVAVDIPLFDKILLATKDVFVKDLSQTLRPNLLHLAAERDAEMCKCVIKHWKKVHKKKDELTVAINQPLENDDTDGRKPRIPAIIAAACGEPATFDLLWPYARSIESTLDSPIDVAIENGKHDFAFSTCILQHGILPRSRTLLISLLRRYFCITGTTLGLSTQSLISVMREMDEEGIDAQAGTWLDLLLKQPEKEDAEEPAQYQSLSILQIAILTCQDSLVHWFVTNHARDPKLIHAFTNATLADGGTVLHLLFQPAANFHHDRRSILRNCLSFFGEDNGSGTSKGSSRKYTGRAAKKRTLASDLDQERLSKFINITNNNGDSCVHYAIKNMYDVLVMDLIDCGADLTLLNDKGLNPLAYSTDDLKQRIQDYQDERAGKKPKKRKVVHDSDSDDVQDSDYDSDPKPKKRRSTRKKQKVRR